MRVGDGGGFAQKKASKIARMWDVDLYCSAPSHKSGILPGGQNRRTLLRLLLERRQEACKKRARRPRVQSDTYRDVPQANHAAITAHPSPEAVGRPTARPRNTGGHGDPHSSGRHPQSPFLLFQTVGFERRHSALPCRPYRSKHLSVYHRIRAGGTNITTEIKKVEGNLEVLSQQLQDELKVQTFVNPRTKFVVVKVGEPIPFHWPRHM